MKFVEVMTSISPLHWAQFFTTIGIGVTFIDLDKCLAVYKQERHGHCFQKSHRLSAGERAIAVTLEHQ